MFANYNGWKHIDDYYLNGEDNEQYATPEGMPSWWTLNLRAQYQVNQYLLIQAACENILDANYRVFASGISAPGTVYRMDEIPLPLRPALVSPYPTDEEVIRRIHEAVAKKAAWAQRPEAMTPTN